MFLDVFLGLTLTGPKKASKSTILYNGLNKEKTLKKSYVLMLPISLLATMKYDCMFLEPYIGGKADKRYVSSPVAKTLVLD